MKLPVFAIIIFLFTCKAFARQEAHKVSNATPSKASLNKEWIGPGGEYLCINDDSTCSEGWPDNKHKVRYNDHTLTLISFPYRLQDEVSFNVEWLDEDTLILSAQNDNAHRSLNQWSPVTFVNLQRLYDAPFSFQRIFFARFASGMRTDYTEMQFDIDSSGAILFSCCPDKGKLIGTYKGQLSQAQLTELNTLIKQSVPERFADQDQGKGIGADAGFDIFRFYYKNKRTEAYGSSMPHLSRPLVVYLESLINNVQLEKVSDEWHNNINTVLRSK